MVMTDEDAAVAAISALDPLSPAQVSAQAAIASTMSHDDPFVDILELFSNYDVLYFRSLLASRVKVTWSPRLTLCAGICELVKDPATGKYTLIRLKLSEPLLKYRPRSDLIDTLLHECIHAYFFITTSWRHARADDGTGHGSRFLLLADAINNHGCYSVTVYHTFHDEVDSYRTHVWQCDGVCRMQSPFFGQVKRSMNRPPGKSDNWWAEHEQKCGGSWTKIAEPATTKDQISRMSAKERAGRQSNKIDRWVRRTIDNSESTASIVAVRDQPERKRARAESEDKDVAAFSIQQTQKVAVACPICGLPVSEVSINTHLDEMHPA